MHPFPEMQSVYYQTQFLILREAITCPNLSLKTRRAQKITQLLLQKGEQCAVVLFLLLKPNQLWFLKVHLSKAAFHSHTITVSMFHYSRLKMCNSLSSWFFSRSASDICLKQSGIVSLMVAFLNFSLKRQTKLEFPLGSPDFPLHPFLRNCYTASAPAKENRNDLSLLVAWLLGEFLC